MAELLHRTELRHAARRRIRQRTALTFGALGAVLGYLLYAWIALEVSAILAGARPEMATAIARDAVAHKVHVTRRLRTGVLEISVESERTAVFTAPPPWVSTTRDGAPITTIGDGRGVEALVDLGDGFVARVGASELILETPTHGALRFWLEERIIRAETPEGAPPWLKISERKIDGAPRWDKRIQFSRGKIEVHRYFWGWENFFFPFESPLHPLSAGEVLALLFEERIDPNRSNALLIVETFWSNPDWQHGHIFEALLATLLMGALGTFAAVFAGLPLAFLAARNFTPSQELRLLVRRLFDFLRGVDSLIWSLIFIRAFGLGPLTGALAIAFTDTGALGKLFSEALENADQKQIEGVRATGADRTQRYRFAVWPQLAPVFASQSLYFLESNMRSATVIGALGAGGIGLVLVETMRTQRDWENVFYIVTLTILLVVAMDALSARVRRRLIEGPGRGERLVGKPRSAPGGQVGGALGQV